MYTFPSDLKQAYESSPLSFVYYQNIDGQAVPVLVSDGFCSNTGTSRENVLEWLQMGLFERIHPDDVGLVAQISEDFLYRRGPYDIVFRCRIETADSVAYSRSDPVRYIRIHGFGKWQTMPDGTELAVIGYTNLSATQQVNRESKELYTLLRQDRFYTDPLTGVPNIN